ncbi:hypothetical protein [Inquilinus sp. OTU3971]|uniref:hypothetical protein n=1 Tax=Inquilinus sp. OTU3971 TaxID=3043855 RepID=UPI00313D875E
MLVVGAIATWHLGGFETAAPRPLPRFGAESVITTNEWRIRPLKAWIADGDSGGDGAFLMVEMWLENRTRRSESLFVEALRLAEPGKPWRDTEDPKTLVLPSDPSRGIAIHPELPARVVAVWALPSTPMDHAEFHVLNREFVERTALIGNAAWARAKPIGVLALAVEDRREPAPNKGSKP